MRLKYSLLAFCLGSVGVAVANELPFTFDGNAPAGVNDAPANKLPFTFDGTAPAGANAAPAEQAEYHNEVPMGAKFVPWVPASKKVPVKMDCFMEPGSTSVQCECTPCNPCPGPNCKCPGPNCPWQCPGPECPCPGPNCPWKCPGHDCPFKCPGPHCLWKCPGPQCPWKCPGPECPCPGPDCPWVCPGKDCPFKCPGPNCLWKCPGPECPWNCPGHGCPCPGPNCPWKCPGPECPFKCPGPNCLWKCPGPECPWKCPGPECPCPGPDCPWKCPGPECPWKCPGSDCPCPGPRCPWKCPGPDCPCPGPKCPCADGHCRPCPPECEHCTKECPDTTVVTKTVTVYPKHCPSDHPKPDDKCTSPSLAVPLRRMWNPVWLDHFYLTNGAEAPHAGANGYREETPTGKLLPNHADGTVPLFRCLFFVGGLYDHFYTADEGEFQKAKAQGCVPHAGPESIGYLYRTQICGSVPLYRLYSETNKDHFYTADKAERDNLIKTTTYKDEGITGYILPITAA